VRWRKAALIGVGLLGGSLGLALKRRQLADSVHGFVRREASVHECEQLGVVDKVHLDLSGAVEGADLIVFCTPLGQMRKLAEQMRDHIAAVVTDVGSVKASVVQELEPIFRGSEAQFVGSHPMAGAEKTGPAAASANLFEHAVCVVTPTANTDLSALEKVEMLWRSVGGIPRRMSPEVHDELVSRSSHLPHVIAAELVNYVLDSDRPKEQGALCANGFRDTTRIASGSPEMWRDICLANRHQLVRALEGFAGELNRFRAALEKGDTAAVERFFRSARERRDGWQGQKTSPSPE
jgi:prephenate dehydrogenase